MTSVKGVVCHWTATPDTTRPTDPYPSLAIVRDGRSGLPGPLAQLGLRRDGAVLVLAAGLSYHAGEGYWPGIGANGNANTIGIEAEEGGDGDWPPAILNAYPRLVAALDRHYAVPLANDIGHYEWAGPRKSDIRLWPGGMGAFRAAVQHILNNPNVSEEDDEMKPILVQEKGTPEVWLGNYVERRWVQGPELTHLVARFGPVQQWGAGTIGVLGFETAESRATRVGA
jgi:hypothetical protein